MIILVCFLFFLNFDFFVIPKLEPRLWGPFSPMYQEMSQRIYFVNFIQIDDLKTCHIVIQLFSRIMRYRPK